MLIAAVIALALQSQDSSRTTPVVGAVRITQSPAIDGRLDDAVWKDITPVSDFRQRHPAEGAPASERTEVRVAYDNGAIYVAARLYMSNPLLIRGVLTRRDAGSPSDAFTVALDTYHDHQTAMIFTVNPAGVRSDELAGSDQEGGDDSWDPVWEAATLADSAGWSAEIRIPLSQLRFHGGGGALTWGINFFRTITARNEDDALVVVRQTETGFASRFAHLTGVRDVPAPRRLELQPYARTQLETHRATAGNPFFDGSAMTHAVGADVKYGITSNLTLDATVHPDFGQVEADPAELNLTVFETFFGERRPFFVEGAQIFAFGGITGLSLAPDSFFHSRRIGRAPTLSPDLTAAFADGPPAVGPFTDVPDNTPIHAAAKLSGKLARGTSIGVLHAETGRVSGDIFAERLGTPSGVRYDDPIEPRARYSVARLKQDLRGGRTNVGAIYTQLFRDLDTPRLVSSFRRSAQTAGIDWTHRWWQNRFAFGGNASWSIIRGSTAVITQAQRSSARYYQRPDQDYLRVDSLRTSLTGAQATAKLRYNGTNGFGFGINGNATSPGYELNDAGFLSSADSRSVFVSADLGTPRPGRHYRRIATEGGFSAGWNGAGDRTALRGNLNFVALMQNGWTFSAFGARGARSLSTVPTRGGPMFAAGRNWTASASVFSDARRPVSGNASSTYFQSEIGTSAVTASAQLTWRPVLNVALSSGISYQDSRDVEYLVATVRDPAATQTFGTRYVFAALDQRTLSMSMRANVTFSPSLSFQMYAEPFTSGASAAQFHELVRPRTFEFDRYDDDPTVRVQRAANGGYGVTITRAGTAPTAFTIANPDASFRSLRGSAVLRWEYRPGATLFAVWTHNREGGDSGGVYGGASDLTSLLRLPPENVFLIKASYWLSR